MPIRSAHGQFFTHGSKDFFLSGKFHEMFLLPDKRITDPDGQFTHFPTGIGLDFDAGFTSHVARHTGGMQTVMNSDPAITDNHFFRFFHMHLLKIGFQLDPVSFETPRRSGIGGAPGPDHTPVRKTRTDKSSYTKPPNLFSLH